MAQSRPRPCRGVEDSLVEALEPSREESENGLRCELLDKLLVELTALRRERNHPVLRNSPVYSIERRRDDIDPEHHPRPASVRVVVHLARAERRRVAVVHDPEIELGSEYRSHGTAHLQPLEGVRDQREDVEAHGREP